MIRQAESGDIEEIMGLVQKAKEDMHGMGIPQWLGPYPSKEDILNDIYSKDGYVMVRDGRIAGYTCIKGKDPHYDHIEEGKWLNEEPYLVLHRTVVDHDCRGQGLAGQFYSFAGELALSRGMHNLRID